MSWENLVVSSFFQGSSYKKHYFVLHDLVHELAVYVMEKFGFMLEANVSHVDLGRPRQLSCKQSQYETAERFYPIAHAGNLHSFLPVRSSNEQCYYPCSNILQTLEHWFGHLRVLSFCGYNITRIPDSIGSLKHLHYLDFSSTYLR